MHLVAIDYFALAEQIRVPMKQIYSMRFFCFTNRTNYVVISNNRLRVAKSLLHIRICSNNYGFTVAAKISSFMYVLR